MSLRGKLSMTARLTALFVLVSCSVLLALGLVVAQSVEKHFEEQDMEVLSGKMELVRHTLETLGGVNDLGAVMQSLDHSLVGHHGLDVLVLGPNQSILFSNTTQAFSAAALASITTSAQHTPMQPAIWLRNGQSYRGIAAPVNTALGKGSPVTVAVAVDVLHHQLFMQSFQRTLWVFIAGAAALAGVLGWAVARQGLAPLRTMRDQTNAVTAQHLSYRLPVHTMPMELVELAQSLNAMLTRLEDAFARLSAFSSDIAHELRTPVSNLMTQTQVALSKVRDADAYRGILESNAEEYEHMARMISDMLLLAKAENGLMVPSKEATDLAAEFRALFDYYEAVAEEKSVGFALHGAGSVPADRLMLRRALGNLLSNAIRHATPGTRIDVTLANTPQAFEIRVQNTGEAIAPEHQERVFERFFRVDPSRQRSSEGTGLGLAITKSIVLAHGGSISAASSGATTTFLVALPRAV